MDWEAFYNGPVTGRWEGSPHALSCRRKLASLTPTPTCVWPTSPWGRVSWRPKIGPLTEVQFGRSPPAQSWGIVEGGGSAGLGCGQQTRHPDGSRKMDDGG